MRIVEDKRGITEEFTTLPAISIVMIGFALFFVLIASCYYVHIQRIENKELYEAAHFVIEKITMDSPLIESPLMINLKAVERSNIMEDIAKCCNLSDYDFCIRIFYDEMCLKLGEEKERNKVSLSKIVAVKINEGDIREGKIVVTVWRKNEE